MSVALSSSLYVPFTSHYLLALEKVVIREKDTGQEARINCMEWKKKGNRWLSLKTERIKSRSNLAEPRDVLCSANRLDSPGSKSNPDRPEYLSFVETREEKIFSFGQIYSLIDKQTYIDWLCGVQQLNTHTAW